MARGLSLHVGINQYRPRYADAQNLKSCHNDAGAMYDFARDLHYQPLSTPLLDEAANVPAVLGFIEAAAQELERDDAFLLTFSGHGAQMRDSLEDQQSGVERDGLDEMFCLHDYPLLDDVVYGYLAKFALGVRVFAIVDSCNSGSRAELFRKGRLPVRPPDPDETPNAAFHPEPVGSTARVRWGAPKRLTKQQVQPLLDDPDNGPNDFITELHQKYTDSNRPDLQALIAIFTACQSDQTTVDGDENGYGLYTKKFFDTWTGNQSCFQLDRALKRADPIKNIVPDFKYYKPHELHGVHFLRHVPFVI